MTTKIHRQSGHNDTPTPTHTRGTNTIRLTTAARRFQGMDAKRRKTPIVGKQEIANIRQALHEGAYQINAREIADKLLAFESFLYKSRQS